MFVWAEEKQEEDEKKIKQSIEEAKDLTCLIVGTTVPMQSLRLMLHHSRRATCHPVVRNQSLKKYGEALAHGKRGSTIAKSGLIRLDGNSIICFLFFHKVGRVAACCVSALWANQRNQRYLKWGWFSKTARLVLDFLSLLALETAV